MNPPESANRPAVRLPRLAPLLVAAAVVLVVAAVDAALRRVARGRLLLALAAVVALGFGAMTHWRNAVFRSEEAMWWNVLATQPHNLRARNDLAVALSERGRARDAAFQYRRVLEMIPPALRARFGSAGAAAGPWGPDGRVRYAFFRAHANLGLLALTRMDDAGAAVRHYVQALRAIPGDPAVRAKLRVALSEQGVAPDELDARIEALLGGPAR